MKSTIILSMKCENLIQRSIMLIKKINVISSRAFEILLQLYSVIDLFKLIGEQTANIQSTMLKNTRLTRQSIQWTPGYTFTENYFLIAAINLATGGPLYTCLVNLVFFSIVL